MPRSGRRRTRRTGPRSGPRRPGCSEDVTLQALKKREIELVPIADEVIASEQEMADAFAENELFPGKFDVAPFFTDEFNSDTTGK